MKKIAIAIFAFQLILLLFFGQLAIKLPQDNSTDQFTVKEQRAQAHFKMLVDQFGYSESFIVAIDFGNNSLPWNKKFALGEEIFQRIADHPKIATYHSFVSQLPFSLQNQILHQVKPKKLNKELPFPFLGQNLRFYTAIFKLTEITPQDRENMVRNILKKIIWLELEHQKNIEEIIFCGEPAVNFYLGQSSKDVKEIFFPLLLFFSLVFLFLVFKSWKILLVTLFSIASAMSMTMGIYALMGYSLNLITNLIPVMILVLTVAIQMHIFLSLSQCSTFREGLYKKFIPNMLVTLTTSIGFGSLATSQVTPIAVLGKFMALGIWVVFLWCYLTHLGLSQILQLKLPKNLSQRFSLASILSRYSSKSFWWIVFAIGVLLISYKVIINNPLESNGLNYFSKKHSIHKATTAMQSHITGTDILEILIPKKGELDFAFYQKVQAFENKLKHISHVRHIVSFASQLALAQKSTVGFDEYTQQSLQFSAQTFATLYREITTTNSQTLKNLLSSDFYRIQVMCDSLDTHDFHNVKKSIQNYYNNSKLTSGMVVTGHLDRIIEVQSYLLNSLSKSLGITITLIMFLMAIFLKKWKVIYISLIPNLFLLGCMAISLFIFGFPTTISTVMVFSIALGIAVDDTIHLLHSFYGSNGDFLTRWNTSLEINSVAVFTTSFVLAGGFLIIGFFSSFTPFTHFGVLMVVGMVMAFVSNVVFLPIVLRLSL